MNIYVDQARNTLNSMLADYDRRLARRERIQNIYRIAHLLEASSKVFHGLGHSAFASTIVARVDQFFTVGEMPPARQFIELLKSQPESVSPSNTYLVGWPKSRTKSKPKTKCLGGGDRVLLSVEDAISRQARCSRCGRVLKVRVPERANEATLPRHNDLREPTPRKQTLP